VLRGGRRTRGGGPVPSGLERLIVFVPLPGVELKSSFQIFVCVINYHMLVNNTSPSTVGLRERKMMRTQEAIRSNALRLFLERGFDETTIGEIAIAAEVSPMTIFRYFPTKEDIVITDDFDPILVERIKQRPANESLLSKIGLAIIESFAMMDGPSRNALLTRIKLGLRTPALRSKRWDNIYRTQKAITDALCDDQITSQECFDINVAAGICLSAISSALFCWASTDGRSDPLLLMQRALKSLGIERGIPQKPARKRKKSGG
jgi:AcrR family transcriptional regulator